MGTTNWNPQQYEKFKTQRTKPFYDLKNLIEKKSMQQVIDLGCGTGELTRNLFDYLEPQKMVGIDSSPEMLEKSKNFKTNKLRFILGNLATYEPEDQFDLVFTNAALQWVSDHEKIIPKILNWVKPGGQIAIQIPFNFDHPSHTVAAQVAISLYPDIFANQSARSTLTLERYAELLFQHGFESQIARIEVYGHKMSSGLDVIEWTKGTLLTAYQSKLSEDQFSEFINVYKETLLKIIGEGPYFYAFKRALIWGIKNS